MARHCATRLIGTVVALLVSAAAGTASRLDAADRPELVTGTIGTTITYQGRLMDGGYPANGSYDLMFTLFDAATTPPGVQVGPGVGKGGVAISQGLFTVLVDFGDVFYDQALWVEVGVKPADAAGDFTILSPRQPLTASPFARASWFASVTDLAEDVDCTNCVGPGELALGAVGVLNLNAAGATAGRVLTATGTMSMTWQAPPWASGTGGSGQVTFWTGASSLSGSSSLFWDATNSRLGLGTGSPSQQLELTGKLALPKTTASAGILMLGGKRFLHDYGPAWGGNTFVGEDAGNLDAANTGDALTAVGATSLKSNTTGGSNTAVGWASLTSNMNGFSNTAVGSSSLNHNSSGASNTAVGFLSLRDNSSGSHNTAIGEGSLLTNVSGSRNVAIGYYAGRNETGSDRLYIGSSSTGIPLIYGQFDVGRVGINTTNPQDTLDVNGGLRATAYTAGSSAGLSKTVTVVKNATYPPLVIQTCTLVFTKGILTGGTC